MPKSRSIVIVGAVFFALGVLLGGTALAEWVDPKVLGLLTLIFVSVRGGWDYFINANANVDASQVVAVQATPGAKVVAGPASSETTGAALLPSDRIEEIAHDVPGPVR